MRLWWEQRKRTHIVEVTSQLTVTALKNIVVQVEVEMVAWSCESVISRMIVKFFGKFRVKECP